MAKPFPPLIDGPVFMTSTQVYVDNVLPNAVVTIYNTDDGTGAPIGMATSTNPGAIWVPLTTPASKQITARQSYTATSPPDPSIKVSGESDPSKPMPVQDLPNPLPSPVFVSGLCTCMDSVFMDGLIPGATLTITMGTTKMVDAPVTQSPQWFQLKSVTISANAVLMATQTASGRPPSPTTPSQKIQVAGPLKAPVISEPLFCGQTDLNVSNLIPGADLEVVNGSNESFITNAWASYDLGPVPPLETKDPVVAHQYFTRCGDAGGPQGKVGPSAKFPVLKPVLKSPGVTTPCTDVTELAVSNLIPGEILTVNLGGALLGQQGVSKRSATVNLPQGWYTSPGPVLLQVAVTLCGVGPVSTEVSVTESGPYPAPSVQPPLHQCAMSVQVLGAHPGSVIQVFNGSRAFPRSNPVVAVAANFPIELWWPLARGESIFVTQTGCSANRQSKHVGVDTAKELPAPAVAGSVLAGAPSVPVKYVLAGAKSVLVNNVVPGAQVTLLVDGEPRIGVDSIQAEFSPPAGTPLLMEVAVPVGLPALAAGNNLTAVQALCGQIGIASAGQGGGLTVVAPVQAPIGGLGSNINYILCGNKDCKPLIKLMNVSVTIEVTEDIVWETGVGMFQGFTFQLNGFSPAGYTCALQQYVMAVRSNELWGVINPFKADLSQITDEETMLAPLPGLEIRAPFVLQISLGNDITTGNVTQVTFSGTDKSGNPFGGVPTTLTSVSGITSGDLAPIVAFVFNLVGPQGGGTAKLKSGAGIITYTASNALTVSSNFPPCTQKPDTVTEMANTLYGPLPAGPSTTFTQSFRLS